MFPFHMIVWNSLFPAAVVAAAVMAASEKEEEDSSDGEKDEEHSASTSTSMDHSITESSSSGPAQLAEKMETEDSEEAQKNDEDKEEDDEEEEEDDDEEDKEEMEPEGALSNVPLEEMLPASGRIEGEESIIFLFFPETWTLEDYKNYEKNKTIDNALSMFARKHWYLLWWLFYINLKIQRNVLNYVLNIIVPPAIHLMLLYDK